MKKTTNAGADASAAETAPATNTPVTPPAVTTKEIAVERPTRGGSYVVQPGGALDRVEATEEPSLIDRVAAAAKKGEADHG